MPRNSSGVYTLPNTVNPVVMGTVISSVWANTTLEDVASTLTQDRLDIMSSDADKGAEMVGASDGASGALWSTVQGFINKITSNTGAAVVRWAQSGLGSVTRSVESKLRETVSTADKGALINGTANDTEAIQAAVSNHTQVVATTGTSIVGAVTLPSANTKFTLQGVFAALANDVTQMQFIADTSRTNVRVMDGGGKFTANGKTGATGVRLGSVTNNPSTGAEEAALYVGFRDLLFTGYQTGVDSRVSMEHSWDNIVLFQNGTGAKFYADPVNGGENANTRRAVRFQSNVVGGILRSFSDNPITNNYFDGATLQGNSVNGFAAIGYSARGKIVGLTFRGFHTEVNGGGASSATVDGAIIPRSDFYFKRTQAVLGDSDVNSSLNPFAQLEDNSVVHAENLTGGGAPTANMFLCDGTSFAFESGLAINTGRKHIESYGFLPSVGSMYVCGAPIANIGPHLNHSTMANPAIPDTSNVIGTLNAVTLYDAEQGAVAAVQFAGSAGSTSTNRLAMYGGATTAGDMCIMAFLVCANADTTFTFNSQFASVHRVDTQTLKAGKWRRIVVTGIAPATTGLTMYIYPNDGIGAVLTFKAFSWIRSTDLREINAVYHYGHCGIPWPESERLSAAPTAGVWPLGYNIYKLAPAAGSSPGWVNTSVSAGGVWKAMAAIAA